MSWGYYDYHYETVSEKKAKAEKALQKLKKKNKDISPIVISGKKIANSFWAMSWNKNLESYADYSNRIGRGSSYLKNGMVLDLKIAEGNVNALVAGSRKTPYEVKISIQKMTNDKWNSIVGEIGRKISNAEELAAGKFPQDLAEKLLNQKTGLFPSPKEIKIDCSCPDWADMCKHAAAALYGIGARFDEDPLLFFKLRGVPFEDLLKKTIDEKISSMIKNAEKPSKRVIQNENISDIFGITVN